MPFSMKNATSTFNHAMHIILSPVKWPFALVYPNDAAIFLRAVEEHLDYLRTVLQLLSRADISMELKKCSFCSTVSIFRVT